VDLAPGSRLRADCFTDHDRGKTLAAKVAAAADGAIWVGGNSIDSYFGHSFIFLSLSNGPTSENVTTDRSSQESDVADIVARAQIYFPSHRHSHRVTL
jgi:hypothetical protein